LTTVRRLLNLGENRINGVDADVPHAFSSGGVRVNFGALRTCTSKYLYPLEKRGTLINAAGNLYLLETPKLRGTTTASYDKGDWPSFMRYKLHRRLGLQRSDCGVGMRLQRNRACIG